MSELRIGPDFTLPLDWMPMATVVFGTIGSGKTNFGGVLAEESHRVGQRFNVVDIKGDYWGLKASADGTGEGLRDVVIFGGDHADVPLDGTTGALVGQLVAEMPYSSIIDLEHLRKGAQIRFLADYFEALYHYNRDPLLCLNDEAQRSAPQQPLKGNPDHARCLGAVEDATKLGRKRGLFVVHFTQRGAGLNKNVVEICGMMAGFRTPGVLDQKRVTDWCDANVTADVADLITANLASLPTGTGVFACGHPDFRMADIKAVRLRHTYDSSATPRPGEVKVVPKQLAPVDLDQIRDRMAATIEKAKADDPRELRKQIANLTKQVQTLTGQVAKPETVTQTVEVEKVVEVPVLPDESRQLLERAAATAKEQAEELNRAAQALLGAWGHLPSPGSYQTAPKVARKVERSAAPAPRPVSSAPIISAPRTHPAPESNGHIRLGKGEEKVLAVLAQWPDGRTYNELAFLAGYSAKASTLGVILANLRRGGLVEQGNQPVRATADGLAAAGGVQPLPRGDELLQHWLRHPRMGEGERRVLLALIDAYPDDLSHHQLCQVTGYSPDASTIGVILSKLRKLGLVEKGQRRVPDEFVESIR